MAAVEKSLGSFPAPNQPFPDMVTVNNPKRPFQQLPFFQFVSVCIGPMCIQDKPPTHFPNSTIFGVSVIAEDKYRK